MRPKIYIVEDMAIVRASLIQSLENEGFTIAGSAASAEVAWEYLQHHAVDLILLDITLTGDYDGIWMAHKIRSSSHDIPILFLTAYGDAETLERLKAVSPDGYIMKPYNEPTLLTNIAIAMRTFKNKQSDILDPIFIKHHGRQVKIDPLNIRYVKSEGNYVDLHLSHQKYTIREQLRSFLSSLPRTQFLQIHQRYVVNASYVTSYSSQELHLGDLVLPISKTYRDQVIDFFEGG